MILLLMGILCVVLLAAALVVVMIQESQKGNKSSAHSEIQAPSNSEFDDFESEKQEAFPFVGMSVNSTDGMITIDWQFPSKNALTTYKIEV